MKTVTLPLPFVVLQRLLASRLAGFRSWRRQVTANGIDGHVTNRGDIRPPTAIAVAGWAGFDILLAIADTVRLMNDALGSYVKIAGDDHCLNLLPSVPSCRCCARFRFGCFLDSRLPDTPLYLCQQ